MTSMFSLFWTASVSQVVQPIPLFGLSGIVTFINSRGCIQWILFIIVVFIVNEFPFHDCMPCQSWYPDVFCCSHWRAFSSEHSMRLYFLFLSFSCFPALANAGLFPLLPIPVCLSVCLPAPYPLYLSWCNTRISSSSPFLGKEVNAHQIVTASFCGRVSISRSLCQPKKVILFSLHHKRGREAPSLRH